VGSGRDVAIGWVCVHEWYRYDLTCWRDAANERWRACFVVRPKNVVIGHCCCHSWQMLRNANGGLTLYDIVVNNT
jgi:hypothetical protein